MPTEHKRGPRTSHIQIWAYSSPHSHQNYYYHYRCRCLRKIWSYSDHMTQRFQFVCRFIKILYFLLSSDTTVQYIDCPRNFSTSHWRSEVNDIVYLEQRRSDTIDEKGVTLIYDYGLEILFSEWIRRWDRDNAVALMQDYLIARRLRNCVDQEASGCYLQLSSLHLWLYNALYSAWDLKIFL